MNCVLRNCCCVALFVICSVSFATNDGGWESDFIEVQNPKTLNKALPAERLQIGGPYDYKPCIAKLPSGELLLVGFHAPTGAPLAVEYCFLYRSQDGGRTWSKRYNLDLIGREPYLSVTSDGVVFITTHVLSRARGNNEGYTYCYLYRSDDGAKTWEWIKVPFDEGLRAARRDGKRPEKAEIGTSRNVLELRDGSLVFGVSSQYGAAMLWRSRDKGKTWKKTPDGEYGGPDIGAYHGPIYNEAFLFEAASGELMSIKRVSLEHYPAIPGTEKPASPTDQYHRLVQYETIDAGRKWSFKEFGSYYGEMYPAILRLQDGRVLFTFTQRTAVPPNTTPLGVRAVLGQETSLGVEFDFTHDRIVLSAKTPEHLTSGGGFGPTVQLDDGTLLTSYSYRRPDGATLIELVRWRL